jgi:hypothetical protein
MIFRAAITGAVFAAALMTAAWADIVHLRGGGRLEGEVEVQGDTVTVTSRYGSTSVPLSAVDFVEKTATVLEEYKSLTSKAAQHDLQAQRNLANFCRKNSLAAKERYHLLLILRLRPGDIEARSRLGYVRHRGRWVTRADEMYDRGLTRFRGEWVTPVAKEAVLKPRRAGRAKKNAERRVSSA